MDLVPNMMLTLIIYMFKIQNSRIKMMFQKWKMATGKQEQMDKLKIMDLLF